jgi:hypothetical protein
VRIAYVSLHWPRTRKNGVGKKIQSQITAWKRMGHDARLFMHTEGYEPRSDLIEAECVFYTTDGKFRTELNRIAAMRQVVQAIREYHPDVIYLRYGTYVYPAHLLMDIAPVVEEINTNDLTQHEELAGIYNLYNRLTRGIFLRRVRGLVTVSHELALSPAFRIYRRPTSVIANGVDLADFPQLAAPSNEIPRIVFMGNPGYLWHGVDKLVHLAKLVPDLYLDIIGYDELSGFGPLPTNITLHGYLTLQEYQNVLASADVAISSLALHRIQLEEASPLKSRECLAFGLPLVIAYVDTDLDDMQNDFVLKIPNKQDNIHTHFNEIRDFAYRMRGLRAERQKIVKLDLMNKEMKRIAFFEEILKAVETSGAGL